MVSAVLGGLLLLLLLPLLPTRGSAPIHPPEAEPAWGGEAGEEITSLEQKAEGGWSPSLQQEEGVGTEHWVSGDMLPLRPEQWQPVEALGPPGEEGRPHVPLEEELSRRTRAQLETLARSAHLAQPRLGLDTPLDPLASSSTLKYVHEGELLKLRLLLDNLTLEGLSSLSVQEVTFQRGPDRGGEEEVEEEVDDLRRPHQHGDEPEAEAPHKHSTRRQGGRRNGRRTASSRGLVRAAFTQVVVRARYQVRGSAGGFLTFRESGNLTLTAPTVFLTSRLGLILPPPTPLSSSSPQRKAKTPHRRHGGRVKIVRVRSEVTTVPTTLTLQPAAHPPQWVRQQVQTKLEELSGDLSHGHGAVRLLLHRWGKLLKRLIHRTARAIA